MIFHLDVILDVINNIDNLDDIVGLSLVDQQLNDKLKGMFKHISKQVGVNRPVLDWYDLIRENSKVNATRYSIIKNYVPDYPDNITLLVNAIISSNYQLIDKYHILNPSDDIIVCLKYAPSVEVALYIEGLIDIYIATENSKYVNHDIGNRIIVDPSCIVDGQFSVDLYLHYTNHYLNKVILYGDTIQKIINVSLSNSFNSMIKLDIDIIQFTINNQHPIIINNIVNNMIGNENMIYMDKVGPNNLKYINHLDEFHTMELFSNPRSQMVIDYIKKNNVHITNEHLLATLEPSNHYPHDHLLTQYLIINYGLVPTNKMIDVCIQYGSFKILEYLITIVDYQGVKYEGRYYSQYNLTKDDILLINSVRPDFFNKCYFKDSNNNIYGGTNDDYSLIKFLIKYVNPPTTFWLSYALQNVVESDNICTLKYIITQFPYIYQLEGKKVIIEGRIVKTITDGQLSRYNRY